MISENEMQVIRKCEIFQHLSEDVLKEILAGSSVRCHPKNHVLFLQNDPAEYIYIVIDGWIKTFRETIDGDEAVIDLVTTGDSIGEPAMFVEHYYQSCAQTVTSVHLLPLSVRSLKEHMEKRPEIAMGFLAHISKRLYQSSTEIASLKTRSGLQRVANFLLQLSSNEEGSAILALPYEKTLIAQKLGMQPESFSRVLSKLARLGIRTSADKVLVPDITSLQSVCENGLCVRQVA